MATLAEDPNVAVLHLSELELVLGQQAAVHGRGELKHVLDVSLVSFKAVHVVQGVRLVVVVCWCIASRVQSYWLRGSQWLLLLYDLLSGSDEATAYYWLRL